MRLSLGWIVALLTVAAVAARAEGFRLEEANGTFADPVGLPNIVRFTTVEATQLTQRLFWERRSAQNGAELPGFHDLCDFDRPDNLPVQHWWALHPENVTAPSFVSADAAARAVRVAAADRRQQLIADNFPQWAPVVRSVNLAFRNAANSSLVPVNSPRATYIAFGKIVGRTAGFDGIAGNADDQPLYANHGDYVPERDGTNTKGYLPVAICALIRTPEPW